jgi:heme A synthase
VCAGVALVLVQVLLGLLNVVLRLPTDLREAHAVNAALMFLAFVIGAVFATIDSLRARTAPAAAA